MKFHDVLRGEAQRIVRELAEQFQNLRAEVSSLEEALGAKRKQVAQIEKAASRLANYQAKRSNGDYVCPNCWVTSEQAIVLRPVLSPSLSQDIYECRECHSRFRAPA